MKALLVLVGLLLVQVLPAQNLALNKPVVVSSTEVGSNIPSNVNDGNTTTRWSSLYADPQWVYVDLQGKYQINRVILNWEAAYGRAYQIQISDDAVTWNTVYLTTASDGKIDQIDITPVTTRYVRMYGTTRATKWGYSLWEFEVYGSEITSVNCDSIYILRDTVNYFTNFIQKLQKQNDSLDLLKMGLYEKLAMYKDSLDTKQLIINTLNDELNNTFELNKGTMKAAADDWKLQGQNDSLQIIHYQNHKVFSDSMQNIFRTTKVPISNITILQYPVQVDSTKQQ